MNNEPKKYRKRPLEIEAIQFFNGDGPNNIKECLEFVKGRAELQDDQLIIETLEGYILVSDCDYIIKGIKGEFYPCKPDIFEQSYEEI